MKAIFLLLPLLFFSSTLRAQNKLLDSLQAELSSAKTDSAKVLLHSSLSKYFLYTDAKKAIAHGQAAERLAATTGFSRGSVKALNNVGNAHLVMGAYDKAMAAYFKALHLSEQVKDTAGLITAYNNLGNVYFKIEDVARASKNYQHALFLAQKVKDELREATTYNNLGNLSEAKGAYPQALRYFMQAATIQEKRGDKRSWAISLHNIGNVYLQFDHPEDGLPYLFRAVQLNEEIGNDMIRMTSLGRIAQIYQATGQPHQALTYAKQSLQMAQRVESSKKIAEAAQLLHVIYAALREYDLAYQYLSLYMQHNELLHAESRTRIESELTAKYEIEQRELENQQLKAEREKQASELRYQQYLLALGGAMLMLVLVLLVVTYRSRLRLKGAFKQLQEAHERLQLQQKEIMLQKDEIQAQAQVLQEQNVKLELHNQFKNKVFSIVSHDLRGPLLSIKGILTLAHRKTLAEKDVKHIFSLLEREMDVTKGMLDNLLIWAKTQLEASSLHLQELHPHQLVEQNLHLLLALAEEKGIKLTNGINEHAVVTADKERLNFVLRNLIANAVKFSFPGGEINVQLQEQEAGTSISVRDTGKGISKENMAKLFSDTRFTSLGTAREKGTGLGLMLSKELLESFGARLSVKSEEGKGSTFSVFLSQSAAGIQTVTPYPC